MSIRWDSLLVRHLARELDGHLAGSRLRAVRLDGRARDMVLLFREVSLVWRLHPDRSTVLLRPSVEPAGGDHRLKARLRRVEAPPDERIVRFELVGESKGAGLVEILVELIGNRLNAVVAGGEGRTMRHVLVRREGARPIAVGHAWKAPEPTGREGVGGEHPGGELSFDRWREILAEVPPPDRSRELLRRIAWTSPLNAETFLEPTLEAGYETWTRLEGDGAADRPDWAHLDRGLQPYPFPLRGYADRPVADLLEAFETAAAALGEGEAPPGPVLSVPPALLERLDGAIDHAERRLTGLRAELDAREDPQALRSVGDLLLARFSELPEGVERATLTGFDGDPVEVELDPELPPHQNAASYYDRARRSERAAERIPGLMAEVESRLRRLRSLRAAAGTGDVEPEELRAALPPAPTDRAEGEGSALPYRVFRTSGGLEVRVGRGARHNDDLTFHHSAPDDVWLHARHAAGAHVILRWSGDDNPPARDLAQAGVLAALHSRARTSTSVPVDWTRRKYVRKPRGSAPGSVVPDRVQTIFVRPDEKMLEALTE